MNYFLLMMLVCVGGSTSFSRESNNYYIKFNRDILHKAKFSGNFFDSEDESRDARSQHGYSISLGYKSNNKVGLSGNLTFELPRYAIHYKLEQDNVFIDSKVKLKSYLLIANLLFDMQEYNNFTPYFTFGAGIAKNITSTEIKGTYLNEAHSKFSIKEELSDGKRINLVYRAGIGVKYQINSFLMLGIEGQLSHLGKFITGNKIFTAEGNTEIFEIKKTSIKSQKILFSLIMSL